MVDLLISRGFPADRFYTIYNGIDFTPPPTQGDRLEYLRAWAQMWTRTLWW